MKVPGNDRSRERKFLGNERGTKVLHRDLSFLGTKGLAYEKSVIPGQLADTPTRRLDDSRTGHLVDWSTRGLDNSRTVHHRDTRKWTDDY